jgi:transcriptional regulator with XRE-family HTH domain
MTWLRDIRERKCLSIEFMAECLHMDPRTLALLEDGKLNLPEITDEILERLTLFGWLDRPETVTGI